MHKIMPLVNQMRIPSEFKYLGELSDYAYEIHDYKLAESLLHYYDQYIDETYCSTDFVYLHNQFRHLKHLEKEGNMDKLISELSKYSIGMKSQISKNIPSMSDEQREFFAEQFDHIYNYSFKLLQKLHNDKRIIELCFNNILFRNGLLLRSNETLHKYIAQSKDETLKRLSAELDSCKQELIYQSVSGRFFQDSKELENQIEEIGKQIAIKCTDFKTKNEIELLNHETLRESLKDDEAVIILAETEGNYMAFVLKEDMGINYKYISSHEELSDYLKMDIYNLYHNEQFTYKIWEPIDKMIGKDCKKAYYFSTGAFNQIAISSLYTGNDTYVCDAIDMLLISDPASIVSTREDLDFYLTEKDLCISLWGGIDYGYDANLLYEAKRTAIKRGEKLCNLRYALHEVNEISSYLKSEKYNTELYTGKNATENAFKQRSNKGDHIIHISTHGFFEDNSSSINSMLNSGLFFAGANSFWSNDTIEIDRDSEDGILRSEEISSMNLLGCSLVVLSACETGLGYNNSSEGVFGLQRAFKLAGAEQILMTLWEVDDRATSLLMVEFYKQLAKGKSSDEALKISKRIVRNTFRSAEHWGAFILLH